MTKLTKQERSERRLERLLRVKLRSEARLYAQIMQATYTRLGEFWASRFTNGPEPAPPTSGGKRRRRNRKRKEVEFDRVFINHEVFYYKIRITKKGFFGVSSALPHRVRAADLVSPETLFELCAALERIVEASKDPTKGTWIIVYRLGSIGGLLKYVTFQEILKYFPDSMARGSMILGVGPSRQIVEADLDHYPHVLIGGTTGSGKSNIMNCIIASFIRFTYPSELRLYLVDLKGGLEFLFYRKSPHVEQIVTTSEGAKKLFQDLFDEIGRRYKLLADAECKNFSSYNALHPETKLPRIVCVIDEFAELVLSGKQGQDITSTITRLTNLGRAIGVNVFICTQRPGANILDTNIRNNLNLAIGGKMANSTQSRIILDDGALADIPDIKGRMILRLDAKFVPTQTPHISDDDVRESVRISQGLGHGVISLNRLDYQFNAPGLDRYIASALHGEFTAKTLTDEMMGYGISRGELRSYIHDLKTVGTTIDERIYRLEKSGVTYHLVTDSPAPEIPSGQFVPDLPVASTPDTQEFNEQPVVSEPPSPELSPLECWLRDRCVFHPLEKMGTTEAHEDYVDYCTDKNEVPDAQRTFVAKMKTRGIKYNRGHGRSEFLGVRLKMTEPIAIVADSAPRADEAKISEENKHE